MQKKCKGKTPNRALEAHEWLSLKANLDGKDDDWNKIEEILVPIERQGV